MNNEYRIVGRYLLGEQVVCDESDVYALPSASGLSKLTRQLGLVISMCMRQRVHTGELDVIELPDGMESEHMMARMACGLTARMR